MFNAAPQPSVIHIVTLFRQIAAGEIRIPAFQREFVWTSKQVIELLESVRVGYPIGSLLLWYVDQPILKIAANATTAFPDVSEKYPTSYVLDGMQRLSSLYGVFHYGATTQEEKFNVWYDLQLEEFYHEKDLQSAGSECTFPLMALFNPRMLLDYQGRIASRSDSDLLIAKLLDLQASFQDYMVPVVTIRGDDVSKIVGIFEKINSTGTVLDTVDFMRAITWDQEFDLSEYLERVDEWLVERKYNLPDETIIKCIGLTCGIDPTPEELLHLRKLNSRQLITAFENLPDSLGRVMSFLADRFKIHSSDYVPYEGQTLVLFKAVGLGEAASRDELDALARWFWAAGFNESLRGKPDHYVVRAVQNWRELVRGRIRGLEPRLRLTPDDFVERRLIKGKALSAAFASMLAVFGAHSFFTEELISPEEYMTGGDPRSFVPIFDAKELRNGGLSLGPSARIFANLILVDARNSTREISPQSVRSIILTHADADRWDLLRSQFIDEVAVDYVRREDPFGFSYTRAQILHSAAEQLVEN